MQIKDINSTVEHNFDRVNYPANFDTLIVFHAMVKKEDWKNWHKMVVKIPAERGDLQQVNRQAVASVALKKMQDILKQTKVEPDL